MTEQDYVCSSLPEDLLLNTFPSLMVAVRLVQTIDTLQWSVQIPVPAQSCIGREMFRHHKKFDLRCRNQQLQDLSHWPHVENLSRFQITQMYQSGLNFINQLKQVLLFPLTKSVAIASAESRGQKTLASIWDKDEFIYSAEEILSRGWQAVMQYIAENSKNRGLVRRCWPLW